MKKFVLLSAFLLAAPAALGQGTLVFDQQSADEATSYEGGALFADHPVQSFTPNMTSVGFVRLYFMGVDVLNARVNLRADSPSGPLLGTTEPVTLASFTGRLTLFFNDPIGVTPGTTYFLEPLAEAGGGWLNASPFYNYPGGSLVGGNYDLWFREGIVVIPDTRAFSVKSERPKRAAEQKKRP